MTVADRQLVEWYFEQPGRSTACDMAVGYLIKGGCVNDKVERECKATLAIMRVERARSLVR